MHQIGENHHRWKGGRFLNSRGYWIVRVRLGDFGYHLREGHGYALEHRIITEQKIGRKLRSGEQVHHINKNRKDNRPENLEVVQGNAGHWKKHIKLRLLRKNSCSCGCGGHVKYDSNGKLLKHIKGHPTRKVVHDNYKLAQKMKYKRKESGLTQPELGIILNMHTSHICKIEKRKIAMPEKIKEIVLSILKMTNEELRNLVYNNRE